MNTRTQDHTLRPGSGYERPVGYADVVLRIGIVALALGTAYIHATLGGPLFTLNAIGFFVGALAMVVPLAVARRYRWVVPIGLAGYAATTIGAWAVDPTFFATAYVAKAIEVALIALLAIDFARRDGNPIDRVRDEIRRLFPPHGLHPGRPDRRRGGPRRRRRSLQPMGLTSWK